MYPQNSTVNSFGSPSAIGSAYVTPSIAVGLAPLDELSKQLENAVSRTFQSANHIKTIADNLFGAIPESAETSPKVAGRSGKVGCLNDQAEVLHSALSVLDNQLARLASLTGNVK